MKYKIRSNRILRNICIYILLILSLGSAAFSTQVTKQLAPGVSFYQDINTDAGSERIVNVITVDIKNPAVKLKAALGKDVVYVNDTLKGRETISSLTARKGALVGVNADYFPFTGDPLGMCVIDGELISEPPGNRAVLGMQKDGSVVFSKPKLDAKLTLSNGTTRPINGINRNRDTNQVIAYTDTFGASTQNKYKGTDIVLSSSDLPVKIGEPISLTVNEVKTDAINTPIPKGGMVISAGGPAAWFLKENLKPGDTITAQFDIKSETCSDWGKLQLVIGGGPWLVRDGSVYNDYAEEGFNRSFSTTHHPRTAIGVTADNKLLIVTVDGRQAISKGISLSDLAELMKQLGAVNSINLDGGGSTTLSIKGLVVNSPSGGQERPVADALLVYADQPTSEDLSKLTISGVGSEAVKGEGSQLFLTWGDDAQILTEDQLSRVVWGTTNGVGFVNQKGYFTPGAPCKGTISAFYGAQSVSLNVQVVDKPTAPPVDTAPEATEEIAPVIPVLPE